MSKNLNCKICDKQVKNVSSTADAVTCSDCIQKQLTFALPEQIEPTRELKKNQFYLLVNKFGDCFKTRYKPEINAISENFGGIIFNQIVSGNKILFFKCGSSILRKAISSIKEAKQYAENGYFDLSEPLDLKGHVEIQEVWIEIKSKPQTL